MGVSLESGCRGVSGSLGDLSMEIYATVGGDGEGRLDNNGDHTPARGGMAGSELLEGET